MFRRFPLSRLRIGNTRFTRTISNNYDGGLLNTSFNTDSESNINIEVNSSEDTELSPSLPNFHELSAGGYNGKFSEAYNHSDRAIRILSIYNVMKNSGESPKCTLSYNYILSAMLESRMRQDAFQLLRTMETQNINPDLFTFELLLNELSRDSAMAMTVDELFQLMQKKYGISGSALAWGFRIKAWLSKVHQKRALYLLNELRSQNTKVKLDPELYYFLALVSLKRGLWEPLSQILSHVKPLTQVSEHGSPLVERTKTQNEEIDIILSTKHYHQLLLSRLNRLSKPLIPFTRYFLSQLEGVLLDEGVYSRILYYSSKSGYDCIDLAYLSLTKLTEIYSQDGLNSIPRSYLESFLECVNAGPDPEALAPHGPEELKKYSGLANRIQLALRSRETLN